MKLSIPAKVFLGFASILAAFGLVTAFGLWRLHDLDQGLELVSSGYQRLSRSAAQLESSWRNGEQATGRLLDDTDGRARSALLTHAVDYQPRVARDKLAAAQALVETLRHGPEGARERAFLDRVEGLLSSLVLRYDRYAAEGRSIRALVDRRASSDELEPAVRQLKAVEQGIGVAIRDLSAELDLRIDQRVRHLGAEQRRSALLVLLLSLAATAVGLFVTLLAQRTLKPIRRLTEAVKELGEGRFHGGLAEGADDELGLLSREFNAMARKLAERDRELAEKTDELLQSERLAAVGRMAAQITHEIRNPLASLSLNAELLAEQLAAGSTDPAESRALVAALSREVDRLAEVTEEYLRFARLPRPAAARLDAGELIDDFLDFTAPELSSLGLRLERTIVSDPLAVRADDGQLRQVLLNLVRNARDAAGRGGTVRVAARRGDDGAVELEVADDGPGIPDEVRARMFDPFFTTKPQGTGLGLAVVRQIVRDHGGELVCETAPGHGTRMIVRLPPPPAEAA